MDEQKNEKPTENRVHYYVSIAFYDHKVFKCAGLVHDDPAKRDFYRKHYAKFGGEGTLAKEIPGGYKVLELPYVADRITEDGKPFSV